MSAPTQRTDTRKAYKLAMELSEELNKCEAQEADKIAGFDATDLLTTIRAARDKAVSAASLLEDVQP